MPTLEMPKSFNLIEKLHKGFTATDVDMFKLIDYNYHPTIKAPMAI